MAKTVSSAKVEDTVRTFITRSNRPVSFSEVMTHVADKFPNELLKAVEVKLATYRVIERGQAKVTKEWEISANQLKQKKAISQR